MNDEELNSVAEALERSSAGEPQSLLSQGIPDFLLSLTLNREGCLAFAANLLRLAALPPESNGAELARQLTGIEQLDDEERSLRILVVKRSENLQQSEIADESLKSTSFRDRLMLIGCALICFLFAMTFVGGIFFWGRLFFGQN